MTTFAGLPVETPKAMGFSPQKIDRITQTMDAAVAQNRVPGVTTVIGRQGKIVHSHTTGYLDIDKRNPLGVDALFRMYSQTKPITAVVVMRLFEEGLFMLDEPLSKYVPEFANLSVIADSPMIDRVRGGGLSVTPEVPARRDITIYDLLTMTSGLSGLGKTPIAHYATLAPAWEGTGFLPGDMRINDPNVAYDEMVLAIANAPLHAQPGDNWNYGSDFDVLSLFLERLTGKDLDELFRTYVLDPLGMENTQFYCPADQLDRLVTDHAWDETGNLIVRDPPETAEKAGRGNRRFRSGNGLLGGILSTAEDFTRFAQMLLNGGHLDGAEILGRKTIELMTADHIGPDKEVNIATGPGYGFGFGYAVRRSVGGTKMPGSPGTFGWGGAAGTWFFVDPAEELYGLFFTHVFGYQFLPTADLFERFEKMTYEALI
ncbi:MAG: serine hydrolase [Pseudomonadota bacterium]